MERHLTLLKIYQLSEKLKKNKGDTAPASRTPNEKAIVEKLSYSTKNLLRLLLTEESINQRTIAKIMSISSQAVSENIKKLEQLSLVEKIYGTQNNENIVSLTSTGRKIAINLDIGLKKHAEATFSALSDEEMETLNLLLNKIL